MNITHTSKATHSLTIPTLANEYTGKDLPLKPDFRQFGLAEGREVPYTRHWWIQGPKGRVIGHLEQLYWNPRKGFAERLRWARSLGAVE